MLSKNIKDIENIANIKINIRDIKKIIRNIFSLSGNRERTLEKLIKLSRKTKEIKATFENFPEFH